VGKALADGGPSPARAEAVRPESWEAKVDELRGHVAAFLAARRAA
jgi:hypothetical protein